MVLSTDGRVKESSKSHAVCLADFNEITDNFLRQTIHHAWPYTATERRACHIIQQLPSVWNEVLSQAKMELRQSARTRTGMMLMSLEKPYVVDHTLYTLHHAARLLYRLVQTQNHVTHIGIAMGRLNLYEQLLRITLHGNESVETLKLRDTFKQNYGPHRNFCAVIPTLQKLRHFACTSDAECRPLFVEALTSLLMTTSLESLHVPDLRMRRQQAEAFLTAFTRCPSLKELSLNFAVVTLASQECCATFAYYMRSCTALTSLIFAERDDLNSDGMQLLPRGVSEKNTIARIEFKTALLQRKSVQALADVLAKNAMLCSTRIVPSHPYYDMDILAWDAWLTALIRHEVLREAALPFCICTSPQWTLFFQALSRKHHVRKVLVIGDTEDTVALREVCDAIRVSGAEVEVVFGPYLGASCYRYSFHLVKYKCFRNVLVSDAHGVADAPLIGKHLHQLCSLNNTTSLKVHVDPTTCKHSVSSALSDYVGTTTPLKKLRLISLSFEHPDNQSDPTCTAVVKSFTTNSSLSELCVRLTSTTKANSERLADVTKCSDNIRSFIFWVRCAWPGTELLSRLSGGIHNNYNLLSVQLPDYMKRESFAVWDTTRRIFGLLASAVQFLAAAECDRLIAASLERVYQHTVLLEELAEVRGVSVDELAAAIRRRIRAFKSMHDFMQLAGVVKEKVACHARDY